MTPEKFTKIAAVADLEPGKMRRIDIAGRRILLANVGSRFYATADRCTHEEASLSTGSLKGEFVKCPLHGSRFNVCTGQALEEPADENLRTYAVRWDKHDVWADLG